MPEWPNMRPWCCTANQRAETITTRSNLITHPGARDVIRRTTVRALTAVAVTAVFAQPPSGSLRGRPADRFHGRGGRRQPLPPDGAARPANRLPADVPRAPLCRSLVSGPDGQRHAARVRGGQVLRLRAGHGESRAFLDTDVAVRSVDHPGQVRLADTGFMHPPRVEGRNGPPRSPGPGPRRRLGDAPHAVSRPTSTASGCRPGSGAPSRTRAARRPAR